MTTPAPRYTRADFAADLHLVHFSGLSWTEILLVNGDAEIDDSVFYRFLDGMVPFVSSSGSERVTDPPTVRNLMAMFADLGDGPHQWKFISQVMAFEASSRWPTFASILPFVSYARAQTDGPPNVVQEQLYSIALNRATTIDELKELVLCASTAEQKQSALMKMLPLSRMDVPTLVMFAEKVSDPFEAVGKLVGMTGDHAGGLSIELRLRIYGVAVRYSEFETRVRHSLVDSVFQPLADEEQMQRALDVLCGVPYDSPLFLAIVERLRGRLSTRTDTPSKGLLGRLAQFFAGVLREDRLPAPMTTVRLAYDVTLTALEWRVNDYDAAVKYMHRVQAAGDPSRKARALALVRQYAIEGRKE